MIFFFACLLACFWSLTILRRDLDCCSKRASERESFASGLAGSSSTALEEAQGREREREVGAKLRARNSDVF